MLFVKMNGHDLCEIISVTTNLLVLLSNLLGTLFVCQTGENDMMNAGHSELAKNVAVLCMNCGALGLKNDRYHKKPRTSQDSS